jgi:hypothetical protein
MRNTTRPDGQREQPQRQHAKTVLTDIGAVGLAVPRDRAGAFEPQIVRASGNPAGQRDGRPLALAPDAIGMTIWSWIEDQRRR